ncbi:MAG: DsbA family protein, partial [Bradyrhizobium sp.]
YANQVLKVDSTPTFFINGKILKGDTPLKEFEKKINPLLKG